MHEGDRDAALTDGCRHALHRSGTFIADREDPRGARFESERLAIGLPLSRLHRVGSRQDEAVLVARDLLLVAEMVSAVPAVDGDDLFNWSSWCRPKCFAGWQATDGQQASLDVGIRNPEQVTDLGFVGEMKCGHT